MKPIVIMLVDDNPGDNYFHTREIKKIDQNCTIVYASTGLEALSYLELHKETKLLLPQLIFLDINMSCMDGWEFLEEFTKLDKDMQDRIIIMLSTSQDPDDFSRALKYSCVTEFIQKPLTEKVYQSIIEKYF